MLIDTQLKKTDLRGNSVKKLVALFLALSCGAAQASLIEYNDYTLDTDTAIVTGGGLEWLQWSETKGLSIAEVMAATSSYATDGWRLAYKSEMAALFNDWQFTDTLWDEQASSRQRLHLTSPYEARVNTLISFIGVTDPRTLLSGTYEGSSAIFQGLVDGVYGQAFVTNMPTNHNGVEYTGTAFLGNEHVFNIDYSSSIYGFALVRDLPSVSVPEPASLGLLVVGLAGIAFKHRKN
ncbi:PEP-CTERM sorting domain-containing protein [Hydrocarboniclastica marina]|uniref:PEP-CTERM sorting domain-containing protein n=1 Tax=Hydrocarboniclastica marina TaxID=2259620 RepID=UPI0015623133|nr:PEP-CTERM sorting domain-containing protein [Hydrocarboniclastica marina]